VPAEQTETIDVVHSAAVPISIEIDAMVAALPADSDLSRIAFDLIFELASMSNHPQFIAIFREALIARRTLIEQGISLE
jgi:hypothetical protein